MWNGKTHPAFSVRVAKLNDLLKKYPAGGQTLAERIQKNTAAPAATATPAATAAPAAAAAPATEGTGNAATKAGAASAMVLTNLAGAPLRLQVAAQALQLVNDYSKPLVGFELGCVATGNKITYRFGWKDATTAPKQFIVNPMGLSPDMGDVCAGDQPAKLAVISAKFADGKSWSSGN